MNDSETVHASAARVGESGVLVRGAPGTGKSSLVLALIDRDPEHTVLVADDRVCLAGDNGRLVARVPASIAGRIEVRGLGIDTRAFASPAAIDLVVDLLPATECPRLPSDAEATAIIDGVDVRRLCLPVGLAATDAALRVALALSRRDHLTR